MAASYQYSSYHAQASPRDRAVAVALAVAIAVALIVALLRMGGLERFAPEHDSTMSTFNVGPDAQKKTATARKAAQPKPVTQKAAPQPRKSTTPPPPKAQQTFDIPGLIRLSSSDYAKSDIGKIKGAPAADKGTGDAQVADSGAPAGAGEGPGGQRLYNAEWYREPTRAEMVTYLPPRTEEGWGMIACRTIPQNRVDDCREIGESPGSGMARGLRQAAWQFLIRPPRIDGKPLIGAWVRIKYDLIRGVAK